MTETDLHRFLKKVGMAYLYNQNCFLVATEVHISRGGQKRVSDLDNHFIIDVCGVGEKYIPDHERDYKKRSEEWMGRKVEVRELVGQYKYNIVRGIEVKVSREDFKTGFICSGCNYNYLMVPEGLVWTSEVPKKVGVIKVDPTSFTATFTPAPERRFYFAGLRILRKPTFQKVEQYQIDNAISGIAKRSTRELIGRVAEDLASNQTR